MMLMNNLVIIQFIALLLIFTLFSVNCVKINNLNVPEEFYVGSSNPLILDCEYEFTVQSEGDDGLFVKWFFNKDLIYQWNAGHPPKALSKFTGRLKLNYTVSEIEKKKYRALVIVDPTVDLSGTYECKVETYTTSQKDYTSEDSISKNMTIIVAPKEVIFPVEYEVDVNKTEGIIEDDDDEYRNVTCQVIDVYPQPVIEIQIDEKRVTTIQDVQSDESLYSLSATVNLTNDDYDKINKFTCILSIPGTKFQRYYDVYSGNYENITNSTEKLENDGSGCIRIIPQSFIICLLFLLSTIFNKYIMTSSHICLL